MESPVVDDNGMIINKSMDEFERYKLERKKRAEQRKLRSLLIMVYDEIQEVKRDLSELKTIVKGRPE